MLASLHQLYPRTKKSNLNKNLNVKHVLFLHNGRVVHSFIYIYIDFKKIKPNQNLHVKVTTQYLNKPKTCIHS